MTEKQIDPTLAEAASAKVGTVAADLRDAAAQKLDDVVGAVSSRTQDARAAVAGEVGDVASALRRASRDLRSASPQERTLALAANSLADAAEMIRDKDLGEMLLAANRLARNNPVLFFGGAVLLGFAASRFAKSSSRLPPHLRTEAGREREQVGTFISEGNPNADPVEGPAG